MNHQYFEKPKTLVCECSHKELQERAINGINEEVQALKERFGALVVEVRLAGWVPERKRGMAPVRVSA